MTVKLQKNVHSGTIKSVIPVSTSAVAGSVDRVRHRYDTATIARYEVAYSNATNQFTAGIAFNRENKTCAVCAHDNLSAVRILVCRGAGMHEFERDAARACCGIQQRADARLIDIFTGLKITDVYPHRDCQRILLAEIGKSDMSIRSRELQRFAQTESARDKMGAVCIGNTDTLGIQFAPRS